jgi:hypothetical protein
MTVRSYAALTAVGSEIALRDVWFGRPWRANAARVVESAPDLVVLWMPTGSPARYPVDATGDEVRIPSPEPVLAKRHVTRDALALERTGARHSIWLFWDPPGSFAYWYVNFERTLGWNGACFDTVDEKLDLIVGPDKTMRWKDEDELEHAASLGLLDSDEVRAEAERVVTDWPFPTGWEGFLPDPDWSVPRLPSGWDRVAPRRV